MPARPILTPVAPKNPPLPPIEKEGIRDTVLIDYSTTHESPPDRHVYVLIPGPDSDMGPDAANYANELLDQIFGDKLSVNAPKNEADQDRDARRMRNRRCSRASSRSSQFTE